MIAPRVTTFSRPGDHSALSWSGVFPYRQVNVPFGGAAAAWICETSVGAASEVAACHWSGR